MVSSPLNTPLAQTTMATLSDTLRTALSKGVVRFTFTKKDGTTRHAIGTRNLAVATATTGATIATPCGTPNQNAFYDLEKLSWRSFVPTNVVSIDG